MRVNERERERVCEKEREREYPAIIIINCLALCK